MNQVESTPTPGGLANLAAPDKMSPMNAPTSQRRYWILFGSLALSFTGLDLLTKYLVFDLLQVRIVSHPIDPLKMAVAPHKPMVLIPDLFELEANINYGGFSGWFSQSTTFLTILSVLALFVIAWFLWSHLRGPGPHRLWFAAALGLLWGGTCGNFYDRLAFGYVRDFIKWFYRSGEKEFVWPNFNIADSAITVGVGIILVLFLFAKNPSKGAQKT